MSTFDESDVARDPKGRFARKETADAADGLDALGSEDCDSSVEAYLLSLAGLSTDDWRRAAGREYGAVLVDAWQAAHRQADAHGLRGELADAKRLTQEATPPWRVEPAACAAAGVVARDLINARQYELLVGPMRRAGAAIPDHPEADVYDEPTTSDSPAAELTVESVTLVADPLVVKVLSDGTDAGEPRLCAVATVTIQSDEGRDTTLNVSRYADEPYWVEDSRTDDGARVLHANGTGRRQVPVLDTYGPETAVYEVLSRLPVTTDLSGGWAVSRRAAS